MKPFCLPLKTCPYEDFKFHGKRWELRLHKGAYNPRPLVEGRDIKVRKGHSGNRYGEELQGTIGKHIIGTLDEVLDNLSLEEVFPRTNSKEEAIQAYFKLLNDGVKSKEEALKKYNMLLEYQIKSKGNAIGPHFKSLDEDITKEEVMQKYFKLLRKHAEYIAFEVILD